MRFVTTADGTDLYVKEWGSGSPVVLMHGWPLTADTFDDLAMTLAETGLRAIAYDRRGFGRSAQPWSGYDYNTLADDLQAVMTATDCRDATLVGFSMGGGEVARYMSRHQGANVSRAVLISAVVPYMSKADDHPEGVDASVFEGMAEAMRTDRAAFWTSFFKDFYGLGALSRPVSSEVVEWSCRLAMQAGLKPTLACAEAFATTDFRPDLAAFTVPTLIIHGTSDKTVPIDATARKAAAGIAGSTLLEYDGAPHGLLATHKDRIAADVLAFVTGRPHTRPEVVDSPLTLQPGALMPGLNTLT